MSASSSQTADTNNNGDAIKHTFSFAAAGWLQMYHFGVAKALQDVGLTDVDIRYAGSSAGALASAALVFNVDFDALRDYAIDCCADARSTPLNAFKIREYVGTGIDIFAVKQYNENPEVREHLDRQLEVYATVLPWIKAKCFDKFEEAEDLKEALIASCCITPLAGLPFPLRKTGEWVMDGGLAAFQPRKGEDKVITVSPLYFTSADIKPTVFIPAWWGLYPPSPKEYRELYDHAYNDAIQCLITKKMIDPKHIHKLRDVPFSVPGSGFIALFTDLIAGIFFVCIMRPIALILIYGEMFAVATLCVVVAALHDILPASFMRQAGQAMRTRSGAFADFYHSVRNLVSMRVGLHLLLGQKIPVNAHRLERFSKLYRVFRPFL